MTNGKVNSDNRIIIVQGGQYGSEAKGAIAGYLCEKDNVDVAVRTGATNAGHTVYHEGREFKMQQLPVGFVNPNTRLVLGAGALIDPEILDREVTMLEKAGFEIRNRLSIDRRAGLHVPAHAARSRASGRHHAIGATGKGCSEALMDRIRNRGSEDGILFGDSPYAQGYDVCDTESLLNFLWNEGAKILLEGTQGQMLDLYLGPYPYTTHKQTGPAQWMLEAGLSPALPTDIVMVVRTYPIRVAGNSGPLPFETSWSILARGLNSIRADHGKPPLVSSHAIDAFESAVKVASSQYMIPDYSNGLDQHVWSPKERLVFKEALSEVHREALNILPLPMVDELKKLFEMTTVTKKLRRVAALSASALSTSARQCRPHKVALTFANYWEPQHWFEVPKEISVFMRNQMQWVSDACDAPVSLMSYGPHSSHIIDFRD